MGLDGGHRPDLLDGSPRGEEDKTDMVSPYGIESAGKYLSPLAIADQDQRVTVSH
jgi:hypothetical protein